MAKNRKTSKTVQYKGKARRYSYTVSWFSGKLMRHQIGAFKIVKVLRKIKMVELSNGIGSFRSFLDRKDAIKAGLESQRTMVELEKKKLARMERDLR